MIYRLEYSKKSLKRIKKLDKYDQERVLAILERACVRPRRYAEQLATNKYFRLRAGKLSIIIDIQDQIMLIMVVEVDKRDKIYK